MSRRSKVAIAAGAGLGATVLFAPGAQAATFTVTKLADTDDGVCDATDCSLREAADAANAAADADTITFASSLSGTINLGNGQIPLYAATDVQGPGADVLRVSGGGASRIFYVNADTVGASGDPVSISGLRIVQGYDSSDGGALYSDETVLTLANMVFNNNSSDSAGGAVHTDDGNVFVDNTVFSNNRANSWGGAFYLEDTSNSAADDVEARISNSVFVDNVSGDSGGGLDIDDPDGDTIVENSTFTDNSAADEGGGITVNNINTGDLTVRNVTINNNKAAFGGGFYSEDVEGTTLIQNSTLYGNQAFYDGGGINFGYLYNDQVTAIRNSTIAGNYAAIDPLYNGDYSGGGVFLSDQGNADPNGPVQISSTIIANNYADTGPDLGQDPLADGFNTGFSLIKNTTGATIGTDPAGSNITGADPQLGGLYDNGGPTLTMLPTLTSPVLDAGVANGASTDQRGLARTAELSAVPNRAGSDGTDIGAVEIQSASCQGAFVPSKTGTEEGETIEGTDGPDALLALGGDDTATGLKAKDCVDGADGNDTLKGNQGGDLATGGGGDDNIDGGKGKDKVKGQDGKDTVKGGKGKDKMKGNGGKDLMKAVDGTKDKVNCGGGKDKAKVDAIDKVNKNCEVVKVSNK